ncbi:MAG: PilZ domain-containing protein [Pyrinomonadaceae bacterium]|nr:PilZ domain-containing protein [Pyrinomonadaceae bacterium]
MLPKEPDEALSAQERRQSDRKKLIVGVSFEGGDATGIANTRDIGVGGLYIATNADLESGQEISMEMTFGGEDFNVKGVVAYVDAGQGVGVRFKDLTIENVTTLKRELELD